LYYVKVFFMIIITSVFSQQLSLMASVGVVIAITIPCNIIILIIGTLIRFYSRSRYIIIPLSLAMIASVGAFSL